MASILLNFNNKLGDHLICHGIVREYAKRYDEVGMFYIPKDPFKDAVMQLITDLPNVHLVEAINDRHKRNFLWRHAAHLTSRHYDEVRTIIDDPEEGLLAERQFYALAGVPHHKKWENFSLRRNKKREEALYKRLAPSGPYVFVHDDTVYGGLLDEHKLPNLPRVIPAKGITSNIFDYCTLIERAAEVHVVDSVFMFLVDLLPYDNPTQRLVVHRYARTNPPWKLPVLRKNWDILP